MMMFCTVIKRSRVDHPRFSSFPSLADRGGVSNRHHFNKKLDYLVDWTWK
jgi:hypothetical protein